MKNHRLYETWDKVPVTYYQEGTQKNILQKIWHGKKVNLAKKIIGDFKFKNCLDVGCASGFMVSEIARQYPTAQFFGIDVYDKAVEYGRKKYKNIKFKQAAAEKIPYQDQTFDLIICYETIEHVEHPLKSLQEMRRVLKKEGQAIVTMDSGNWLFRIVWFFWEKSKGKVWQGAHLHPFHHVELGEIIKKSGFKTNQKIFSHWGMEVTFVLTK